MNITESTVFAPHGVFCRAIPTTYSISHIIDFFSDVILVRDLHCTLIFSKEHYDALAIPDPAKNTFYDARVSHLSWIPGHDEEGYLIAHLISASMHKRNAELRAAGIIPTFDEYMCHMTLVNPAPFQDIYTAYAETMNSKLESGERSLEISFYDAGYVANTE